MVLVFIGVGLDIELPPLTKRKKTIISVQYKKLEQKD